MPFDSAPQQKPRLTASKVRQMFPKPDNLFSLDSDPVSYCVGGAYCLYRGNSEFHFPTRRMLANILRADNPHLTYDLAYIYACEITSANDGGFYEAAWERLDEALSHGFTFKPVKIPVPPQPEPEPALA